MFGRGVISLPQRAADTVWNISLALAGRKHWDASALLSIGVRGHVRISKYVGEQTHPVSLQAAGLKAWPCMSRGSYWLSLLRGRERENAKLQRLGMNERGDDVKPVFSWDLCASLYLLRSAGGGGGDEGIKDSVQADSLFIHPLPPTTTTPLNMPVGECSAIRSLQMKASLIWSRMWG